jgi:hypothetical protein
MHILDNEKVLYHLKLCTENSLSINMKYIRFRQAYILDYILYYKLTHLFKNRVKYILLHKLLLELKVISLYLCYILYSFHKYHNFYKNQLRIDRYH